MSVSSNTLFHFVKEREYLEEILNGVFYPRYCLENFGFRLLVVKEAYVLMKCFCDIPLSQIADHTKLYGSYGVGFSKEWGVRQKISPILYLYKDSNTYRAINRVNGKKLDEAYAEFNGKKTKKARAEVFDALSILTNIKPVSGKMLRDGKEISVTFYNEREWRYVPKVWEVDDKADMVKSFLLLPKSLVDGTPGLLDALHDFSKKNLRIPYTADDVKYIFVENDADREYFFDFLSKSAYWSEADRKKLMCKIVTVNQIKEDF